MQSERMFAAIRGNGGTARLVMLPFESHGYRGRESVEHVLWEQFRWMDKYVKDAKPRSTPYAFRSAGLLEGRNAGRRDGGIAGTPDCGIAR